MTWQEAKKEAADRIALLPLPAGSLAGLNVALADYDNDRTLRFDQGTQANLNHHRAVIRAMKRALQSRGASVTVAVIVLDSTFWWNKAVTRNEKG